MLGLAGASGVGPLAGAVPADRLPTTILVLVEQPVHTLSHSVGAPFRAHLLGLQAQARGLVDARDSASRERLLELNVEAERTLSSMRRSIHSSPVRR